MDNKFIEEDWERDFLKDEMYIREREIQMQNDWWQWECEQMDKRKPAKINVVMPKLKNNEIKHLP